MIDFWIAVGLLLLVAMSFLLIPLMRGWGAQSEEDRTALNVAVYQERLTELETQQAQGVLSAEQRDDGQAEAARELLADTHAAAPERVARLGKALPLMLALLLPVIGLCMYLYLGASDRVELAREFSQPPASLAQMTDRLERAVKAQPDAPESVYFLARAYMAQDRPADAARTFERAAAVAGRQPELLGQWAQALYFANHKRWSERIQKLAEEALALDAKEVTSLGLMGINAFESKRFPEAVAYWTRLLAVLPADDPSRAALQGGIDRANEQAEQGSGVVKKSAMNAAAGAHLTVQVSLADEVRSQVLPTDAVFVFARAVSGPPVPLAVKRMTVADLPIEVELSDADAMMPQLKLSNFAEVQLVARVSRAGQPTVGEWIGRSQPLPNNVTARQALTIDSPDQLH